LNKREKRRKREKGKSKVKAIVYLAEKNTTRLTEPPVIFTYFLGRPNGEEVEEH